MKDCICISHRSARALGKVFPFWSGWKWLKGHLEFTEAYVSKKVQRMLFETVVAERPSRTRVVLQQQIAVVAMYFSQGVC
jgi:hypothetical protein